MEKPVQDELPQTLAPKHPHYHTCFLGLVERVQQLGLEAAQRWQQARHESARAAPVQNGHQTTGDQL